MFQSYIAWLLDVGWLLVGLTANAGVFLFPVTEAWLRMEMWVMWAERSWCRSVCVNSTIIILNLNAATGVDWVHRRTHWTGEVFSPGLCCGSENSWRALAPMLHWVPSTYIPCPARNRLSNVRAGKGRTLWVLKAHLLCHDLSLLIIITYYHHPNRDSGIGF